MLAAPGMAMEGQYAGSEVPDPVSVEQVGVLFEPPVVTQSHSTLHQQVCTTAWEGSRLKEYSASLVTPWII